MAEKELQIGIEKLTTDLDSGAWSAKYGYLRQQQEYDAGYCILVIQ